MEITPDMITQFGLMNKISTGHSVMDILLCLLVPVIIRQIVPLVQRLLVGLVSYKGAPDVYKREIQHVTKVRASCPSCLAPFMCSPLVCRCVPRPWHK